jgi:hypothetical protein
LQVFVPNLSVDTTKTVDRKLFCLPFFVYLSLTPAYLFIVPIAFVIIGRIGRWGKNSTIKAEDTAGFPTGQMQSQIPTFPVRQKASHCHRASGNPQSRDHWSIGNVGNTVDDKKVPVAFGLAMATGGSGDQLAI